MRRPVATEEWRDDQASAVTHWGIPVNDLDAAEQFYTEIMGFRALGRLSNGHMSCMEVLGQEIVLFQRKEALVRTPQQDGLLHPWPSS